MRRQLLQLACRHLLRHKGNRSCTPNVVLWQHRLCSFTRTSDHENMHVKTTQAGKTAGKINIQQTYLEVSHVSWPRSIKLNYVWLRDHCRCNTCYNHTTHQRNLDILDIPLNIQPKRSSIQGEELLTLWPDGHESAYSLDWLWRNSHEVFVNSQIRDVKLWDGYCVEGNIAKVDVYQYMNTEKGVYDVVKSLVEFGVGIVINVPTTVEATEEVVQQISHVQHTLFGGMWQFSNKLEHYDTAYTQQALGAHNDNTYFTEAAGLQVFHCVQHDGDGGETLLVDGFRAADDLKRTHPQSFHRLSTIPLEAEYLEPRRNYYNVDTMLKLHPITKQMEQIRFNLLDRATLRTVPAEEIPQLYEDICLLATKVKDPAGEWWFKLQPGTVLLIDNWRVLHGRGAYTGFRKMTGCYVGRADYMSKARVLGLV
ncbi:trimethyllysine dioxygenase, mitochondrial [Periplaneta americana]|uniref:trimethyllysine dioxygenase, mitochondrial n=1 Tax=Periplaneta americana TaxID=6978 RepID=UPI0037E8E035